jgi:hypothetical protein
VLGEREREREIARCGREGGREKRQPCLSRKSAGGVAGELRGIERAVGGQLDYDIVVVHVTVD